MWIGSRPGTPSTGSFTKKSSIARAPASHTGVPNKYYRVPNKRLRAIAGHRDGNPHKQAEVPPARPYENLPGCPTSTARVLTSTTGVPDKNYRGARQILPGCPTSTTGVPDKYCGVPNKSPLRNMLQNGTFCLCSQGSLCYCFSCSVMFKQQLQGEREDYPWGLIASS